MAAKWWPNTTHFGVGTKSLPSLHVTAAGARLSSMVSTLAMIQAE
jgi:hypothetical protein